jgi:hypothetical protein
MPFLVGAQGSFGVPVALDNRQNKISTHTLKAITSPLLLLNQIGWSNK